MDGDGHCGGDVIVGEGVAVEARRVGGEAADDAMAGIGEVAGDDEAVAAVVAGTAEDRDGGWAGGGQGGEERLDDGGGVAAGVFHEDDAGEAEVVDGALVDVADLGSGEGVHGGSVIGDGGF